MRRQETGNEGRWADLITWRKIKLELGVRLHKGITVYSVRCNNGVSDAKIPSMLKIHTGAFKDEIK